MWVGGVFLLLSLRSSRPVQSHLLFPLLINLNLDKLSVDSPPSPRVRRQASRKSPERFFVVHLQVSVECLLSSVVLPGVNVDVPLAVLRSPDATGDADTTAPAMFVLLVLLFERLRREGTGLGAPHYPPRPLDHVPPQSPG